MGKGQHEHKEQNANWKREHNGFFFLQLRRFCFLFSTSKSCDDVFLALLFCFYFFFLYVRRRHIFYHLHSYTYTCIHAHGEFKYNVIWLVDDNISCIFQDTYKFLYCIFYFKKTSKIQNKKTTMMRFRYCSSPMIWCRDFPMSFKL